MNNIKAPHPKVTILMATWNGERWILEQTKSIFAQIGCNVDIVVSDDHSSDRTLSIINEIALGNKIHLINSAAERFGTANKNFIHLILSANVDDAEYISFSDQDDIWNEDKLRRAIACIETYGLDGYSSNVIAFWENNRSVLLKKSGKQKRFDYLFESAGPGCTFVIKKYRFLELREWVRVNVDVLNKFIVHDWFIYAYARTSSWKWYIDEKPSMMYRQHFSNEIGANVGISAAKNRLLRFVKSDYLQNSLIIAKLTAPNAPIISALERFSLSDMLYIVYHANDYRRKYSEVWALRVFILIYWICKGWKHGKG